MTKHILFVTLTAICLISCTKEVLVENENVTAPLRTKIIELRAEVAALSQTIEANTSSNIQLENSITNYQDRLLELDSELTVTESEIELNREYINLLTNEVISLEYQVDRLRDRIVNDRVLPNKVHLEDLFKMDHDELSKTVKPGQYFTNELLSEALGIDEFQLTYGPTPGSFGDDGRRVIRFQAVGLSRTHVAQLYITFPLQLNNPLEELGVLVGRLDGSSPYEANCGGWTSDFSRDRFINFVQDRMNECLD
jgi:hypothetical protein